MVFEHISVGITFKNNLIYLFLAVLLCSLLRGFLSLVVAGGGYSLVFCRLLIMEVSLVAECGL